MRVIAGSARRLQLVTVPGLDTRPTSDKIKETLFNILQPELGGCEFLDLFAGSGAIGIEALSRGARHSTFVENSRRAQECIRRNLAHTRLESGAVLLPMDVLGALTRLEREKKSYDIIFMDPPYGQEWEKQVLMRLSSSSLATEDTTIIVEANLETDFSYVEELGFEMFRFKEYKTNQHVFLRRYTEGE
ncbi:MAG: 16S rRNA (guanine(966)-N(2))-methyltransferase RsmD [Lachnospiraceae bacterium]|nr:16S rRNA (guanine(966)-N(2))-methyltransferase RsmD [Lachnospiraceae bacterium]